jgi:hypothetical protein
MTKRSQIMNRNQNKEDKVDMRSKRHALFLVLLVLIAGSLADAEACSSSWFGWSALPGNGILLGAPAATFFGGDLHLFARGADSNIYENVLRGSAWSGWSALPGNGILLGAPAVTFFGGGLHVFARGGDSNIYENVLRSGGAWSGWSALPFRTVVADPAVVVSGAELHVFATSSDSLVYESVFRDGAWGAWSPLPFGIILGAPAAIPGTFERVFVRGTDSLIYQSVNNGFGFWSDWTPLSFFGQPIGRVIGDPAAAIFFDEGTLRIFARGLDNAVYSTASIDGINWIPWDSASVGIGTFLAGPAVVSTFLDGDSLFSTGLDSNIWLNFCVIIG